jgi:hypothetical protein
MIGSLFDLGTKAFIEASLDDEKELRKPIIFAHVAKTAGSSFREELADRFQPSENVFVDFSKIELPVSADKYVATLESNLADLDDRRMRKCRMVSGHFSYNQIAKTKNIARGRLVTFIRNPISRLTSFYEYHSSDAHPDNDAFKREYPNFRHFIQCPENINGIYRQLTPGTFDNGADAAEWIKRNYYWVGLQENYVASVKLLFAMNGMRFSPSHSIRVLDSDHSNFDPDDIRLAENLNQTDLQIFNIINEDFSPIWSEIYYLTDYDRIFRIYLGHHY